MTLRVCLAGATGWAGSSLARGIAKSADIKLVSAVSRTHKGKDLGNILQEPKLIDCPIYANASEALAHLKRDDIFFEYTKPDVAKRNIIEALKLGANVVVGTSGLTDEDYFELNKIAEQHQRAILAVGNFALTVVLMQKFAEMAAKVVPTWEIIDYAHDDKKDSPSGTARELASRLGKIRHPELAVPLEKTQGFVEARGASLNGSQIHSVRLPGYTISAEVIFGLPDQRLSIRHDSGTSAEPYVGGALLAIRKVGTFVGLRRGLDSVLELE